MKKVSFFYVFIILLGCNSKLENNVDQPIKVDNNNYSGINTNLLKLIEDYSKLYSLRTDIDTSNSTLYSYNVTFFKVEKDTLVSIVRQPFVFRLFPDFLYEPKPSEIPNLQGMLYVLDKPIFVFDQNKKIGISFYNLDSLTKTTPDEFDIREYKTYDYIVPPMRKYKIRNDEIIFIEETDTIRII